MHHVSLMCYYLLLIIPASQILNIQLTWKFWNISSIILLISSTVYSVCSLGGGDKGTETTPTPINGQPYNNNYYVPQQPAGTVSYYHRHIINNNNKVIICLWLLNVIPMKFMVVQNCSFSALSWISWLWMYVLMLVAISTLWWGLLLSPPTQIELPQASAYHKMRRSKGCSWAICLCWVRKRPPRFYNRAIF